MNPAREWTVFVAGAFALMGGSLIAGAGRRAAEAVVWENERRRLTGAPTVACDGPFLRLQLRLNRGFGAALLIGAGVFGADRFGRLGGWRPIGRVSLALGAALIAAGLAGAAARLLGGGPTPRFVQDEHPEPRTPLDARAGQWLSWAMRAWWLAYGVLLLRGVRG